MKTEIETCSTDRQREKIQTEAEETAQNEWLRWKCKTDLYFLGAEIFKWKDATNLTGNRKRIDPSFHRWLCQVMEKSGDKLILVPRLHLKTTWVKLKIVQDILNNPFFVRIGLFSVSARLVENELADIKRMLSNEDLRSLFPDILIAPGKDYRNWAKSTATQLTVRRDPKAGKVPDEPQVTALGSGAKITGIHLDKLYADDILDPSTVTTADQMNKSEDWWAYMQSIVELDSEICMTGTFYHYSDLYNKIIRENQFAKNEIHIRRAIENGKVLYKSWFRMKDLMKIKQRQGNYIFNCQYLLNPIPQEDQLFPPPHPTYVQLPADTYSYYIAMDPAGTVQAYSDYTAITIAAVNKLKTIYIEESVQMKKQGNEIADFLIMKCMQYKPESVGIELGSLTYLRQIIETRKSEYERKNHVSVPMNIKPIPISRKMDKKTRVNLTLGSFVRTGKVFIKDSCKDLLSQLEFFTGKGKEKDDLVDSASMLFAVIEGYATGVWYEPRMALGPGDMEWWFKKPEGTWRGKFANAS